MVLSSLAVARVADAFRCAVLTAILALLAGCAPATTAPELAAPELTAPEPVASPASAEPAQPASLFNPERHMRLTEVEAGMTGHGLSVFRGTKIERFEVEVVSILRNFNPKYDIVLITCKGANLEHTGAVAGMSGSPVFLKDDAGRERMIGAFAWGWPLAKDPIAGVTPIEYMLDLPTTPRRSAVADAATRPAGPGGVAVPARPEGRATGMRWNLLEAYPHWMARQKTVPGTFSGAGTSSGATPIIDGTARHAAGSPLSGRPQLQPLATPLMVGGISPKLMDAFAADFVAAGLVPLQGGGGSGQMDPNAKLEPGSPMVVTLLTGDAELTAVGTCTEVLGDRAYGFGHPFNNEGAVSLPMGAGKINGVIANLTTSFKLGALTKPLGTLTSDQLAGIAGRIGDTPTLVPIELKISYADGSPDRLYKFQSALHPRFTPLIAGVAFAAAVGGASELPQYNTVDYDIDLEFANGRTVSVADRVVNSDPRSMFQGIGLTMVAAAENPFERVMVKKITGTVRIAPEAREAQITEIHVPRAKYKPGETVKAFVSHRPFRAAEAVIPIELELPRDLNAGQYSLVISDADRHMQDEAMSKPFRFTAERAEEVFDVLKEAMGSRHDALYIRLMRQSDGVAVGRTALPQLPSSRREILMGAGRSNTTPFVSSTVKVVPTDRVMRGSAEFQIQIEATTKVEGAAPATTKPAKSLGS